MSALEGRADMPRKRDTSGFDPSATLAAPSGSALDAGFRPYQSSRLIVAQRVRAMVKKDPTLLRYGVLEVCYRQEF